MSKKFGDIVRNGEVKSPIQMGYSEAKWQAAWTSSIKDGPGEMLFEAGLAIARVLGEIRVALQDWHTKHAPGIAEGALLRYFCAMPNRDRVVVSRLIKNGLRNRNTLYSLTTVNNAVGNELTLVEVGEGTVDGVQKAILGSVIRKKKNINLPRGPVEIPLIDFIKGESTYSQIYGAYESYWNALLWGDYSFKWLDRTKNIAEISQRRSISEISFEVSQARREKLDAEAASIASRVYQKLKSKYIFMRGAGRQRKYCVGLIGNATDSLKFSNAAFLVNISKLSEALPRSFLEGRYLTSRVSVYEMLEVFRCLHLLSIELISRFPCDDSISEADELLAFAPKIDLKRTAKSISNATEICILKVSETLEFLTYQQQADDIWCHPILPFDSGSASLLVAAFGWPNILRIVEHWLVKLDVDLSAKGYLYEGDLLDSVNVALESNRFADDFDRAASMRIVLEDKSEEEIDLLMRIGSTIILAEAKSIVSTDSPHSYYRARGVLKKAAEQATRKGRFVADNLQEVFRRFGFKYELGKTYTVVPVIVNSNRMHVGFPVDEIPVCDERTFTAYFQQGDFPVYSVFESGEPKHLAWLEVYGSPETFATNIAAYFGNLPQVLDDETNFELKATVLPPLEDGSLHLVYRRLLPLNFPLEARLNKKYHFPLRTVDNIAELLSEVDMLI